MALVKEYLLDRNSNNLTTFANDKIYVSEYNDGIDSPLDPSNFINNRPIFRQIISNRIVSETIIK